MKKFMSVAAVLVCLSASSYIAGRYAVTAEEAEDKSPESSKDAAMRRFSRIHDIAGELRCRQKSVYYVEDKTGNIVYLTQDPVAIDTLLVLALDETKLDAWKGIVRFVWFSGEIVSPAINDACYAAH